MVTPKLEMVPPHPSLPSLGHAQACSKRPLCTPGEVKGLWIFCPVLLTCRQPLRKSFPSALCSISYQVYLSTLKTEPTSASPPAWKPALAPPCCPCFNSHHHPQPFMSPLVKTFPRLSMSLLQPTRPLIVWSLKTSAAVQNCFLSTSQPPSLCSCWALHQEHSFPYSPSLESTTLAYTFE